MLGITAMFLRSFLLTPKIFDTTNKKETEADTPVENAEQKLNNSIELFWLLIIVLKTFSLFETKVLKSMMTMSQLKKISIFQIKIKTLINQIKGSHGDLTALVNK